MKFKTCTYYVCLASLLCLHNAEASPPFITDSPEPTDYQEIEFYLFGTMDKGSDGTSFQLPAFEADWGFAPDWQFHAVIPVNVSQPQDGSAAAGQGDIETAVSYRFLSETKYRPQIAIAPAIEWAVGDADKGLGNGQTWFKVPLWMQKSWGSWTTYGGGGYVINSADDMRNYPFAGWVVQHDLNDRLSLAGELFMQSADSADSKSYALVNIGGSYKLNKHFDILASVGHSIAGEEHLVGYFGVHYTF